MKRWNWAENVDRRRRIRAAADECERTSRNDAEGKEYPTGALRRLTLLASRFFVRDLLLVNERARIEHEDCRARLLALAERQAAGGYVAPRRMEHAMRSWNASLCTQAITALLATWARGAFHQLYGNIVTGTDALERDDMMWHMDVPPCDVSPERVRGMGSPEEAAVLVARAVRAHLVDILKPIADARPEPETIAVEGFAQRGGDA